MPLARTNAFGLVLYPGTGTPGRVSFGEWAGKGNNIGRFRLYVTTQRPPLRLQDLPEALVAGDLAVGGDTDNWSGAQKFQAVYLRDCAVRARDDLLVVGKLAVD